MILLLNLSVCFTVCSVPKHSGVLVYCHCNCIRTRANKPYSKTQIVFIQGSRCLLEVCVNRRETLRILRQWHETCVQYNLELTHITKPK